MAAKIKKNEALAQLMEEQPCQELLGQFDGDLGTLRYAGMIFGCNQVLPEPGVPVASL